MLYFVYILKCTDDTLYIGSTKDLEKRLREHNHAKNGAHYTKIRRPVSRVYEEICDTYAIARSREAELKRMTRIQKITLIENHMKKDTEILSTKKDTQHKNAFAHEVILLLDNLRSVQNVASLFRIADCVGVTKIILGGVTPGPLDRFLRARNDFAKISLGAEKTVAWESVENIPHQIRKYKKEGFSIVALEQSISSINYTEYIIKSPTVLIVGTEVTGIAKNMLKVCDMCIEIPMRGQKESLNVAIATSVALFRLRDN